jgi:hypothetical protein
MMQANASRDLEGLSPLEQEVLKPYYPDVDFNNLLIYYNADMKVSRIGNSVFGIGAETFAQTYGYSIYISAPKSDLPKRALFRTLIHELTHVEQYVQRGESLSTFGYDYFKGYVEAPASFDETYPTFDPCDEHRELNGVADCDVRYYNDPLEVQAYTNEHNRIQPVLDTYFTKLEDANAFCLVDLNAVVTIANNAPYEVDYGFRWAKQDRWSETVLQPGQTATHYIGIGCGGPVDEIPEINFFNGHENIVESLGYDVTPDGGKPPSADRGRQFQWMEDFAGRLDIFDGGDGPGFTLASDGNPIYGGAPFLSISGQSRAVEGSPYTLGIPQTGSADSITSVTVNWGDGSSDQYSGSTSTAVHTYAEESPQYSISATAVYKDETILTSNLVCVQVDDAGLHFGPVTLPAVLEGAPTGMVELATFTDDDPAGAITDYTAIINWGDGTSDTATFANGGISDLGTAGGLRTFAVEGNHTYATDGTYPLSILVEDAGSSSVTTALARVMDVPPTAGITGPTDGVRGQERDFTLTATDRSAKDRAAGYTFTIDWGDGSPVQTIAATPDNGSGVVVGHVFTTDGTYNVQVTATGVDDGIASAVVSQQEGITPFAIQDDPLYPGKTMLVIGGTLGNDRIRILEFPRSPAHVEFLLDQHIYSVAEPTSRIVVYGQAGNDTIDAGATITPAWLFGGDGNNILIGGNGNDVLVGGDGNDLLIGNGDRDLLIGGKGADTINAGQGEDILIAGFTDFDHNEAALAAVMAEWTSNHSYADRIANLSGIGSADRLNGDIYLIAQGPAATVHNDSSIDVLYGGGGGSSNWYFADLDGAFADAMHGRKKGEAVADLGAAP